MTILSGFPGGIVSPNHPAATGGMMMGGALTGGPGRGSSPQTAIPNRIIKIGDITKKASTLKGHENTIPLLGFETRMWRTLNSDSTGTQLASGSFVCQNAFFVIRMEPCVADLMTFLAKGTMIESILVTDLVTVNGAEQKAGTTEFGNCLLTDLGFGSEDYVELYCHYTQLLFDRTGRNTGTGKEEGKKSFSTDLSTAEVG